MAKDKNTPVRLTSMGVVGVRDCCGNYTVCEIFKIIELNYVPETEGVEWSIDEEWARRCWLVRVFVVGN